MRTWLLSILVLMYSFVQSQNQSWLGMELSYKPIKKIKIEFGVQHRMNGFSTWNQSLADGKLSVKAIQGIDVFCGYRYGISPNKQSALDLKTTTYRHRTSLGIGMSPMDWINKKSRLSIGISSQIQWSQRKFNRDRSIFRTKFNAKYDIRNFPLTPFASWEYFYDFKRDITYTENEIIISGGTSAFRWFGGMEIELPKSQTIQLGLGHRKGYLSNQSNLIFDLTYLIAIK